MVEAPAPRRGEIWWAVADKRRPVLVVQADFLNRSRTGWTLSVPLTSKLRRAEIPGNVRLAKQATQLDRASVANVARTAPLPRAGFRQRVSRLPPALLEQVDEGLRLVLDL